MHYRLENSLRSKALKKIKTANYAVAQIITTVYEFIPPIVGFQEKILQEMYLCFKVQTLEVNPKTRTFYNCWLVEYCIKLSIEESCWNFWTIENILVLVKEIGAWHGHMWVNRICCSFFVFQPQCLKEMSYNSGYIMSAFLSHYSVGSYTILVAYY